MAPPQSEWRRAGDRALADGEWHQLADVLAAMAPHVPSGQAIRNRRSRRDWFSNRNVAKGRRPHRPSEISSDSEAKFGRLMIARKCARAAVKNGTWERDGDLVRLARRPPKDDDIDQAVQ